MTQETLKQLLIDYGLSPNKTYGQNFLMDEIVLQDMIESAGISKNDVVLEVGPGIGNLTKFLLESSKQVIAIEKDPQFVPVLNSLKKKFKNFSYILSDALEVDLAEALPEGDYKVVANIPYYATGKLIQKFIQTDRKPSSMTLLMQKEVAENITSKPGNLNLLAISVQLYAQAKLIEIVPARKFYPAPKVDSAVVLIELFTKPKFKIKDEQKFFKVLKACFTGKRKQIHNTLTNNLGLDKEIVLQVLSSSKLTPELRPQQLTIDQWINLVNEIK